MAPRFLPDLEVLVQKCPVRVVLNSNQGTGFFVGPGIVLTCLHVVEGLAVGDPVTLLWADSSATARLVAFSQDLDVALLSCQASEFPCPNAAMSGDVETGDVCYSFGFSDIRSSGDPATFTIEGFSRGKPPLLKLKGGQVRPGMSGSPLVNLRTGLVCGILSVTRDRGSDLGGLAIPAFHILNDTDLALTTREILSPSEEWLEQAQRQAEQSFGSRIVGSLPRVLASRAAIVGVLVLIPVELFILRYSPLDRYRMMFAGTAAVLLYLLWELARRTVPTRRRPYLMRRSVPFLVGGFILLVAQLFLLGVGAHNLVRNGLPIIVSHGFIRDFESLAGAVEEATPDALIVVEPGLYIGGFTLDKPLRIVGNGDLGEVRIRTTGRAGLRIKAASGSLKNVTLQHEGEGYVLHLDESEFEVEGCNIDCRKVGSQYACIGIHGGAPALRSSKIWGGENGILVAFGSRALIKENDISASDFAVIVHESGKPQLESNRIHSSGDTGLSFQGFSRGAAVGNRIFENKIGISVQSGSHPLLSNNIIENNEQGIRIERDGKGDIRKNKIRKNSLSGVHVFLGSPEIRENHIYENGENGVLLSNDAGGLLTANELFKNKMHGIQIEDAANPVIRANHCSENGQGGIFIYKGGGRALILENEIDLNSLSGILVENAQAVLERNRIHHNKQAGIRLSDAAVVSAKENVVYQNGLSGIIVLKGSHLNALHNEIYENDGFGVVFKAGSGGSVSENKIYSNGLENIRIQSDVVEARGNSMMDSREGDDAPEEHREGETERQ
jgi:parallel beta-helix repeat protein